MSAAAALAKAKAVAKAATTSVRTAVEKIKPKFGERITIAGEFVYLTIPEDVTKVHTDRIYLGKEYLPEDEITEDVKTIYRDFITTKKVVSCVQAHLDILKKGLLHRIQTIESEAVALKEKGDSISLRERLGHSQKLKDLLETVDAEVRLCSDRAAAAERRRIEEEAAAVRAALDNRPPPLTEDQIRTLVKKFAVLILHAKDPQDKYKGSLNRPAKNLIAKLDAVPDMANPEVDAFKSTHMSNPLLLQILELGQVGFESFNNTYILKIYTKLLEEIVDKIPEEFTQNLPADKGPHDQIFLILTRIMNKGKEVERQIMALNTHADGLQKRIEELGAKVVAAETAVKQDPALVAERDALKADLLKKNEELEKVRSDLTLKTGEKEECEKAASAASEAARAAAAQAAVRIAELETAARTSAARISQLEEAAAASAAAAAEAAREKAAADARVAGLEAEIGPLRDAAPAATSAAAEQAAQIARLTSELETANNQKAAAEAAVAAAAVAATAAAAVLADEQGKHAATKAELDALTATIGVERAAKESAEQARDAARSEAAAAASVAASTIDGLQKGLAEAVASVTSAQDRINAVAAQIVERDAALAAAREEKRVCDEALAAATAGATAAAGTAAEERARIEADVKRLGEEIENIKRERDALKQQQVALAAEGAAKKSELEEAARAIAGLREQVANYEAEARRIKEATKARIDDLEKQLGDQTTEGAAALASLRAQMEAARGTSAAELDRQLTEQAAANKAEVDRIMALLTSVQDQLVTLQEKIAAAEQNKGKLRENLGKAANALAAKTRDSAAALKAREAELLGQIGEGQAALAAAQKAGQEDLARVTKESQAALTAKGEEMNRLLQAKTDEIAGIRAAAAAAAAEAKRLSNEEIAKMRNEFDARREDLERRVADAQLALSEATDKAAKDAKLQVELAVEERRNLLEKQRKAVAESERKCAEAMAKAAAEAKVKIDQALDGLRQQGEAMRDKEASHAAALSALEAKYKKELAEALAAAAAAAEAEFGKRVTALNGEKKSAIEAAIKGAQGAADAKLAADLAAAQAAKNAAVSQATAAGRAAAIGEKGAEIVRIRQEGETAKAAAVEAAKRDAAAAFKAEEARLAGEKEAAIAKAVAEAKAAKDSEFKTEKARLAAAAVGATAAAVAAAKVAAGEKTAGEVAKARVEEAAKTKATDLSTLKDFATQVLAGQARWATYPGANAALATLLGKLDGRMNDTCALVYFVSYFLNMMVKPAVDNGPGTPQFQLIDNIEKLIPKESEDSLFAFLMAIEPALLLANKVRPPGIETRTRAMTYFIKQNAPIQPLITFSAQLSGSAIDMEEAARVVRGVSRGDDDKNMTFFPDNGRIIFLYKPRRFEADTLMRYQEYSSGILNPVINPLSETDKTTVTRLSATQGKVLTFDILFLSFILAAKRYILLRKLDPRFCSVPEEFGDITKGVPFVKSAAPAAQAAAPVAAARAPAPEPKCVRVNIRRMDKGVTANVIILSEDHPTIFAADPYCFVQDGMPLPSKVGLKYTEFQEALDGVVARFCSGQNPKQFQIPPGFRRDGNKDKIIPMDSKFTSATFFDLTNYKGLPAGAFFKCNNPIPAAKSVAPPQSAAVGIQVPALLKQAAESRITGTAPARPISPAAQAEANRLVAAAAESNAGQARRTSAKTARANANAAAAAAAWATPAQAPRFPPRPSSALSVVDLDTPVSTPPPPAACPVPIPVISAVATPNALTQFTGVVLNSATAALLKSPPYCLNVEGYASIEAGKRYSIYNIRNLTDKITEKLPVGQKLSGFITNPKTIQGKLVADVSIDFKNMFPKKAQGFYFLDPPNITREQWGGRRTQKKRRQTSKKFTQRKR